MPEPSCNARDEGSEAAYEAVWVYDDPASGIEISGGPGIGRKVDLPVDLLERFERARQAFRLVAEEVRDAAGL